MTLEPVPKEIVSSISYSIPKINDSTPISSYAPVKNEKEHLVPNTYIETKFPWPEGSYKPLPLNAKNIEETIINDTDMFFHFHGIRLIKHSLPLKLPDGFKDIKEIASAGKEHPPYTSVYRHMCNLRQRILSNWSYIETEINNHKHKRNDNIPFNLRPMTTQIVEQLDTMASDLNDPEFTGVLLTLHTARYKQTGFPEGQCLSKVLGGALVEGLVTNDRCIKAIWIHPQLSARTTRIILQAFIPRVIVEAFKLEVESDPNIAPPFKFVYAMHDDLDMWPRQAWLMMASSKRMGLTRHYEPSSTHNDSLNYDAHIDSGVGLYSSACQCQIEKIKKSFKQQSWLERLIGCTEQQMCNLAFSKNELKDNGNNTTRLGWKDFIPLQIDQDIIYDISLLEPRMNKKFKETQFEIDYENDEWCGLDKSDLIDITSDSEIQYRNSKKNVFSNKNNQKTKKARIKSSQKDVSQPVSTDKRLLKIE